MARRGSVRTPHGDPDALDRGAKYCAVEGAPPPTKIRVGSRQNYESPQMRGPIPYRKSMTPGMSPFVRKHKS